MKQYNEDEIIKGLECCQGDWNCEHCPYSDKCSSMHKDALELINRQKSEIEDLREIVFMDRTEAIKKRKAEEFKEFTDTVIKNICEQVSAPTPSESYIVERCIEIIQDTVKEVLEEEKDE